MFMINTYGMRLKNNIQALYSVRTLIKFNYRSNIFLDGGKTKHAHLLYFNTRLKCTCQINSIKNYRGFATEALSLDFKSIPTPFQATTLITTTQSSKKRPVRRKDLGDAEKSRYQSAFAFATADKYDMELLKEGFANYSAYKPTEIDEFRRLNILHVKAFPQNSESKEIYIFEEGSVVFWNIPEEECFNVVKFIKQFELSSYSESIVQLEQEVMPYTYGEKCVQSDLINGLITLSSDRDDVQSALDKYTFSNAMVLSVKLGIWERLLECNISDVQLLTEDLKLGKKIRISHKEVLRKTGELFSLGHAVNLSSDALDVPDFYWDLETQEKIYIKMCNYFSINRRTTVVNEKLKHCLNLLELLSSQLIDKHHVRLEWMIIILITVEVLVAMIHEIR